MTARIHVGGTLGVNLRIALTIISTTFIATSASAQALSLPISNWTRTVGVFELQLNATGGTPPYTYSLTPGASDVPGMRVRNRPYPMPTFFPSTTTGGYLGVLNTPGVFQTSIRVTDSVGATVDRSFRVTVNQLKILSNTVPPRPVAGVPYDFALASFGLTGGASWLGFNMPPGLSVNNSGHIVGTPTTAGTYNTPIIKLTDTATNSSDSRTFVIVVKPFDIITAGALPDGTLNVPYTQVLQAAGCLSCVFSTTSNLAFYGLMLDSTGVLSGTPTRTTAGQTISVTATGSNGTVTKTFSIKILDSVLQPLGVTSGPSFTSTVGNQTSLALFAGGGTPPYSWSVESGTLPTGVFLAGPGEELGATLLPGFPYLMGGTMEAGTFTFTLRVTDSRGASASRAVTWNVSKLALSYISLPLTGTTLEIGTPYTQRLLGLGGSGAFTWTPLGVMPGGLVLDPATGTISGTPTDHDGGSVSIQLADTSGEVFTTFITLTVQPSSPIGLTIGNFASPIRLSRGVPFNATLIVIGATAPYTVTALTALPPGFALLTGDTSTAFDGAAMFGGMATTEGTFDFRLQVTDALNNVLVRTFRMIVSPLTILTSTLQIGSPSVDYSQRLLAGGGSGTVTWSLETGFTLPAGLALGPGGRISGIPAEESSNPITFVATDALGYRATGSLTLTILSLSISGPDLLPPVRSGVAYNYGFTAAGAVGQLVWSATGLPAGLTLSSDGTLSGTTTSEFFAQNSFSVFVTSTDGVRVVTRRFTLNVIDNAPLLLGLAANPVLSDVLVGQGTTLPLSAVGGIPPYTFAVSPGSALPPGLQLATGERVSPTFTPGTTLLAGAATTVGLYTFDLAITDSTGKQIVRTYTLRVSNMALPGAIRTPRVGEAYAYQFTPVGGTGPYTYDAPVSTNANAPALPPGLTLSASGLLSGTPTSSGIYSFAVTVHDSAGNLFTQTFGVTVADFIHGGSKGLLITSGSPDDVPIGVWTDWRLQLFRPGVGNRTATWSIVGGSLPPGISVVDNRLVGRPSTAGTYVFTVRGTNAGNPSQFAERELTVRVSPMQIVAPALQLSLQESAPLPSGVVGTLYSYAFKVAGGAPPYTFSTLPSVTFSSPFPAGLSLSAAGVLSGTPTQSGTYAIGFVVIDSAGHELVVQSNLLSLTITSTGMPVPLAVARYTDAESSAAIGVDFGTSISARLDRLVRTGVAPFHWNLAPGSVLPPGLAIVSGAGVVSDIITGKPTLEGTYSFTLNVVDGVGQMASATINTLRVIDLRLTPLRVPPGIVGAPYTATLTVTGGNPPYGPIELGDGSSLPPGLTLSSAGVLSGTPAAAGNYVFAAFVSDTVRTEHFVYRLTIDNATGEATAVGLSSSVIDVSQARGVQGPTIPLTISITHGTPAFTAVVSGIPGATLSATSGNTPATLDLDLHLSALATGTYHGLVGVSVPGAVNVDEVTPITITVGPPAIQAIAVTPNAGSGVTQQFTATYSDSAGVATDLIGAFIRFTSNAAPTLMCTAQYQATTGLVRLVNDLGEWGPFTPLGSGTLSNNQCTVNLASTTATPNGRDLAVAWNITFAPAFAGPATIALRARSLSGPDTGFVTKGTWTVGAVLDVPSITPNSGSGITQTFTGVFTDSLGASDLKGARVRFVGASGALCQIDYSAILNQVRMLDDTLIWSPFTTLGSGVVDNNSQCTLDLVQSTATPNGTTLTLVLSITFKTTFVGPAAIEMRGNSNFGTTTTGWVPRGTWNVGGLVGVDPIIPGSGTGMAHTFTAVFTDSLGVTADLKGARVRFVGVSGTLCQIDYNAMIGQVRMLDDTLTWSAFTSLGSGVLDNNSQCALDLAQTTATPSGTSLTLALRVVFKPAFVGPTTIEARANSNFGSTSGWLPRGSWNVGADVQAIAITPNSGAGSSQSFVLTYSDSEGAAVDLKAARVRVVDPISGARCQIDYNAITNQVRMLSDLLEWSGDFPIGGFGTLDNNSQCSLSLSQSSATPSGTNLTVVLAITFKPTFAGLKNIDMRANSLLGSTSGWVTRGTWTVP